MIRRRYRKNTLQEHIGQFLGFFGDKIYYACRNQGLVNYVVEDNSFKPDVVEKLDQLDKIFDELASQFELDLFLKEHPEIHKFFGRDYHFNNKKKIQLHKKIQDFFFCYRPRIEYLYSYTAELKAPQQTIEITSPQISHIKHRYILKYKDAFSFTMFLDNTSVYTDTSDKTDLFQYSKVNIEFKFLLNYFKK
jgi:hypothetical protein